jgi:hypothetical protein
MNSIGRFVLIAPLFLVPVCGCSKNPSAPASISGTVTYKGDPVTGGTLTFVTKENVNYSTAIGADGKYGKSDLPEGEMKVVIETESIKPKTDVPAYGEGRGNPIGPAPKGAKQVSAGKYVKIPDKYNSAVTTDLKVTLSSGSQTQDFELKD